MVKVRIIIKSVPCKCHLSYLYRIGHSGGEERRTPTAYHDPSPFFGEEVVFGDQLPSELWRISVNFWQDIGRTTLGGGEDKLLGKVVFPRDLLEDGKFEEEQWFRLMPPDPNNNVYGEILIGYSLVPDSSGDYSAKLIVSVFEAKNLSPGQSGSRDTYIVCHLLPDPEATTTENTQCIKNSLNPAFNEDIIFHITELHPNEELHISVWDTKSSESFLGHISIPIGDLGVGTHSEPRWRTLLPRPGLYHGAIIKKRKVPSKQVTFPAPPLNDFKLTQSPEKAETDVVLGKAKFFIKAMQSTVKGLYYTSSADAPELKFTSQNLPNQNSLTNWWRRDSTKRTLSVGTGAPTINAMFGRSFFANHSAGNSGLTTIRSKFSCHVRCSRFTANDCMQVGKTEKLRTIPGRFIIDIVLIGTVRLRVKYSECKRYNDFLALIAEQDYRITHIFGKVSKDREEAAWPLIKLMEAKVCSQEFLQKILSAEIEDTTDPRNLFRGNSMASKALDVYMKYLGRAYLKSTLGDIIKSIVTKKVHCELRPYVQLDPLKIEKPEELERSRKQLLEWNSRILQAIFDSRFALPAMWRPILAHIQEEAARKYPDDPTTRYTAVSGFIFLRFFAPTILGPRLFDIIDEYLDPKVGRTLTLLAKTLQNLANLVPFGDKEPYMKDMNSFIEVNIDRMKDYIDTISAREAIPVNPVAIHHVHFETAREATRLFNLFIRAAPAILQDMTERDAPLIRKLAKVLTSLTLETAAQDGKDDIARNPFSFPTLKRSYATLLSMRVAPKAENDVTQLEKTPNGFAAAGSVDTIQEVQEDGESFLRSRLTLGRSRDSIHSIHSIEGEPLAKMASRHEMDASASLAQRVASSEAIAVLGQRTASSEALSSPLAQRAASLEKLPLPTSIDTSSTSFLKRSSQDDLLSSPARSAMLARTPTTMSRLSGKSTSQSFASHLQDLDQALGKLDATNVNTPSDEVSSSSFSLDSRKTSFSPSPSTETAPRKASTSSEHAGPAARRALRASRSGLPGGGLGAATQHLDSLKIMAMLSNAREVALQQSEEVLASRGDCAGCKRRIVGSEVRQMNDLLWHPEHFTCSKCGVLINSENDGEFYNGYLYCSEHKLKTCATCEEPISNSFDTISFSGKYYHNGCFVCGACDCPVQAGFITFEGAPYCREDYYRLAGLMCGVCGNSIPGAYVEIAGRKYHIDCKRCDDSFKPLSIPEMRPHPGQ
ncbi:hypothetical protein DFS34DRAFT_591145 [Phlyctochytrium arcticum]|nr:hypothetical protein DFS34DRAFT_591145 [Phlyctochytrium arcticum]